MASIKPRIQVNGKSFDDTARAVARSEGERVVALLDRIGQEMVDECVRICRSELPTTDHKVNETHLENSFTYQVTSGPRGRGPWSVSLTIKPGVEAGKIWALNYGSDGGTKSYVILPRNVPRALEFSGPGTDYSYANPSGAYRGRVLRPYAVRTVTSGPRQGVFFMERAQEAVLRRYGFDVV